MAELEPDNFGGHPDRECGEHRSTGLRAWCFGCSEWCYPEQPCKGCELPMLRSSLEALRDEVRRLPVSLSNVSDEMVVVRLRPGSKAQHIHAPVIAALLRSETHREGTDG